MIRPATPDEVEASRTLYYAGYFFLPFLWLVNYVQFRDKARHADTPDEMKQYVRSSLIGCLVFAALWGVWLIVFYSNLQSGWAQSMLLYNQLVRA